RPRPPRRCAREGGARIQHFALVGLELFPNRQHDPWRIPRWPDSAGLPSPLAPARFLATAFPPAVGLVLAPLATATGRPGRRIEPRSFADTGRGERQVNPPARDADIFDAHAKWVAQREGAPTFATHQSHADLVMLEVIASEPGHGHQPLDER